MNRNHIKATVLAFAALGTATGALAQTVPQLPPPGWVQFCIDPTVATPMPYSTPYIYEEDWNDLFGVFMGVAGSVNYSKVCFTNGVTQPINGRIGFMIGPRGSAQDEVYAGGNQFIDSWLYITMGMPDGVGGNWGYAVVTSGTPGTAAVTRSPWGGTVDTAYYGASDRYFIGESTVGSYRAILRVDILGDAGRLQWSLTNTGAAQATVGLEYGQWVNFFQPLINGGLDGEPTEFENPPELTYVVVPGMRPLDIDTRFVAAPGSTLPNDDFAELQMPSHCDISVSQKVGYGLDIPLQVEPGIADQTPVDVFDIGKAGFLIGADNGSSEPMPPAVPAPLLPDTTYATHETAFVQRWLPQTVNAGETRVITAYYRNTWSVSDYTQPYNVTLDAPNVISTLDTDPTQFNINPIDIRVYVDNTRGYSSIDSPIPLSDVQVTLNLPQGMADATDGVSTTITQYIPSVAPTSHTIVNGVAVNTPMAFVDFMVNVDPTLFGTQNYSVSVAPNPGQSKVLTGSINIASQPKLNIVSGANLVAAPWVFAGGGDWGNVIGTSTFQQDINFQVFAWDATQQAYVLQTSPQRSFGSFIVSNMNLGFINFNASSQPQEPTDLVDGAQTIDLKSGWNLIANPYNYAIPIGQMVGVSEANPGTAQTYSSLASQGIISPTLAYWDENTQSYKFTIDFNDFLIPNRGYWVFVSTTQDVDLSFGPVFTPFVPIERPIPQIKLKNAIYKAPAALWKLNLAVKSNKTLDTMNYVGVAKDPTTVRLATLRKPPASPTPNAVLGSVQQVEGARTFALAQSLLANSPHLTWNWNVFSRSAGATSVTWPNVKTVPSNITLTLVDVATGESVNMRKASSFAFVSKANANRQFRITADTQIVVTTNPDAIQSLSGKVSGYGMNETLSVAYALNATAKSSVRILKGSTVVATLVNNANQAKGTYNLTWFELGSNDKRVQPGTYTIELTATENGQATYTKTVSVNL